MNWFDGLVLLLVLAFLTWEARQEAGRALLDTLALVLALQLAHGYCGPLTRALQWQPAPGTETSPLAYGLLFAGLWGASLLLARALHGRTRWSMDHFDPLFGLAFGIVIALGAGHVLTDLLAQTALLNHGTLPPYLQESAFAPELRDFRTYHYVLNTFHGYQGGQ